ncbi:MAG TPA: Gfo/Idh/MocA family oxidoreductase [Vicinamibacteria bacterium]|nr:Gfo/Idh/MocA family oxidoreductase [Vicinamibacteria bacterium]
MGDLNVGIVGLGWAAGAHIEAFKHVTGARVGAVCSRRQHDPAQLERKYGLPLAAYDDYGRMLADETIDVVDICSPPWLHAEQAIAAARAGKHVLLEKPIALSWEDAKAVRDALKKARVRGCVCFELRFSSQFRMVKSVVDQGLLGEIHYGEVDYYHGIGPWYGQFPWNVKKDGGGSSLLSAGCHALDALLMVMGAPVEEVTSYTTRSRNRTFAPYEYDTTSATILRFKGGKVGKVASVIDCLQPYYFHTHLVGSEGSLLDDKIHSARLGTDKSRWSSLATHLVDSGDVKDHPYEPQFQAFVDAIRANEKMPLTDLETALETHRVIFAADLSAKKGQPVRVSRLK